MDLENGTIVDRYRVVSAIGHGGMASVYHVQHTKLSSDHVLKVLSLPGRGIRDRLLLEGQVQARLKHRNVVEVTDVVEVQGSPGLVMELIRGPALDAVLAHGPLALERVEELVPGILAGVQAAHDEGVVHRDLKPANILLAVKRGRVVPKVADFGLVKIVDEDARKAKTRTGATMGTPQYMAPEQIQSARSVDARADVFALGAILYELVAGRRAFDGDSHYEVFQAVVERQHTPLSTLRPDLPDRIVNAIDAALQDVELRPSTPEALWEIWRPDDTSLDEAASRSPKWPEALLGRLATLTPSLDTLGASTPFSGSESGASGAAPSDSAAATFAPDLTPVGAGALVPRTHPDLTASQLPTEEVRPAPPAPAASFEAPTPARYQAPLLLAAGVATSLLLLILLGGVTTLFVTIRSPAPPPQVTPALAPAPPAPVAPVTPVPAPVAEPPPAPPAEPAEPLPAPVAPAPAAPVPRPPPVEAPPPEPAGSATGTVAVEGGVPITLIAADGTRRPAGAVPAGTYTVEGAFTEGVSTIRTVTVEAGQTLTLRCVDALRSCNVL